jgi:tetratricopeptide (TPR) repeat protein
VVAKGKETPIQVWEAVQARSRFGMDLDQGVMLPLVGRARELETLLASFERACREREPQLVTVVGVPGIGKSRLVAELFARIDASPEIVWWRQGRALPYGRGVSLWALGEMVKAQAGIDENDPPAEARSKLRASVEAVVPESDRSWLEQHLLPLVGVEQLHALGDRRDESFAAWRRYFEGLAEQRPLVLVFEDLHWADEGLLDFVDHLADWATGVPLLLLGTARPELLDRRPGWGGGKLNATTLALTPLADDDAARIIGTVLEQALLPAETQQALLERAGGNPLYAEQFARLYLERGSTDDLPLPETIQGIIAARLDGLGREEKRLLQDAAVLGKVFWAGGVAELSGLDRPAVESTLHALERRGLVRRERRSAVAGEDELAFRHVLVRDVAYGQIPRAVRGEKHVRAADWVETLGRVEDHAELVAHHFSSALELARAGGGAGAELAERARRAFRRAGDRALSLKSFASAQAFYAQALELWPGDAERPYVLLGHARAQFHAEGAADSELLEAVDALREVGDLEAAAEAAVLAAHDAWRGGKEEQTQERLRLARGLLDGRPPSRALAAVLAESARVDVFANRRAEGSAASAEALQLAEELGLDELRVGVLTTLGVARFIDGDLEAAAELLEQAVEVGSALGSPEVGRALTNLGVVADAAGDAEALRHWHQRAIEYCTRLGDRHALLWLDAGSMRFAYLAGRWDEALTRCDAFLESTRRLGGHYHDRFALQLRGTMLGARGDLAATARDLALSLEGIEAVSETQAAVPGYIGGAMLSLLLGDEDRARALLETALLRAQASPFRAPGITGDAAAAIALVGARERWLQHFAVLAPTRRVEAARLVFSGRTVEGADLYASFTGPAEESPVRLLAARQLAAEGRRVEADAQLRRALAFYRAVGATHVVREAETLLAQPA